MNGLLKSSVWKERKNSATRKSFSISFLFSRLDGNFFSQSSKTLNGKLQVNFLCHWRNVYKVELIINLEQFHLVSFFVSMDVALAQLNVVWASHERCCLQNAEKINDTQSRAELNIRKSPRKPQWFSNRCLMKFVLTCSFFKYPLYVVLIVLTNMKNQNIHTHCEKAFVAQLFDFILSSVPVKLVLLSLLNILFSSFNKQRMYKYCLFSSQECWIWDWFVFWFMCVVLGTRKLPSTT